MSFINSPNMNLPIPVVGNEPGPTYAEDVNNSLTLVDSHDHSPGSGVQITPNGLNINTDLTFSNNFATNVAGVTFQAQTSTPANFTIHSEGVDLYYVDGNGNNIQITSAGGVVGTPGSITGLVSPASATYIPGNQTFVWQSNIGIAANMDAGSLLLRNLSPNSTFALTLSPPAALSSNYTITLPTLPASSKILTISNAGAVSAVTDVDNSTIVISSNNLQVPSGGITATQLATDSVTTVKIADDNVTAAKLAPNIQLVTHLTYTSSSSFVVPAGVVELRYILQGGGGGGGGGGASSTGNGGGGAGGNAGAFVDGITRVTAGQTVTVTVGAAGAAGAGVLNSNGANGGNGGNTSIAATSFGTITVSGGAGGGGGVRGGAGLGQGGTVGTTTARINQFAIAGGAGGASNNAGGPAAGSSVTMLTTTVASSTPGGAAGVNGGGGGAGGTSFYGQGGEGGDAGNPPQAGDTPLTAGSGGGGGGGSNTGSNTGGSGGAGVAGRVDIFYTVTI